jgi:hypothetical protein
LESCLKHSAAQCPAYELLEQTTGIFVIMAVVTTV